MFGYNWNRMASIFNNCKLRKCGRQRHFLSISCTASGLHNESCVYSNMVFEFRGKGSKITCPEILEITIAAWKIYISSIYNWYCNLQLGNGNTCIVDKTGVNLSRWSPRLVTKHFLRNVEGCQSFLKLDFRKLGKFDEAQCWPCQSLPFQLWHLIELPRC